MLNSGGGSTININSVIDNNNTHVYVHSAGVTAVNVAGHDSNEWRVQYAATLKLGVDNGLPTGNDLILGANAAGTAADGKFDLNGYDQTIDQLGANHASGMTIAHGNRIVTNSAAATTSTLTVGSANGSSLFDGVIENGAGKVELVKIGTGTFTLTRANTFTGTTRVNAGTLALNHVDALQGSTLDVGGAGTFAFNVAGTNTYALGGLKGAGSINAGANTLAISTLSPGSSPGTLDVTGNLTLRGDYLVEVSGSSIDLVNVSGVLDLSSVTDSLTVAGTLVDAVYIIGTYGSSAADFAFNTLNNLQGYAVDYQYEGNKIALIAPAPIPTPAALPAGLVVLGLGWMRRRR